jgi:hypothetical protein
VNDGACGRPSVRRGHGHAPPPAAWSASLTCPAIALCPHVTSPALSLHPATLRIDQLSLGSGRKPQPTFAEQWYNEQASTHDRCRYGNNPSAVGVRGPLRSCHAGEGLMLREPANQGSGGQTVRAFSALRRAFQTVDHQTGHASPLPLGPVDQHENSPTELPNPSPSITSHVPLV